MTFTLDTSGFVRHPSPDPTGAVYLWTDLSPFAQGYVEALLTGGVYAPNNGGTLVYRDWALAFSDLAPEALALILKDCANFVNFASGLGFKDRDLGAAGGRRFWNGRQNGAMGPTFSAAFPPLTPTLGADGKVSLSPERSGAK